MHVLHRQSLNSLSSRWRRSKYGSERACEDGVVALWSVIPCISAGGRLCAHLRVKITINPAPFTMTNNGKSQADKAKPCFGGAARIPSPPISLTPAAVHSAPVTGFYQYNELDVEQEPRGQRNYSRSQPTQYRETASRLGPHSSDHQQRLAMTDSKRVY